jgi:hypothetical protein
MPTLQELIDEHVRRLNPLATVYVGIFQAVSRAVVAENAGIIFVARGPIGRTVMVAESPYVNDELNNRSPNGIRYYVATAALADTESTMRYLVFAASHLHTLAQVSCNASAWPLQLRLMSTDALGNTPFRQLLYEPEITHPINARLVDIEATQALWAARWAHAEDRVARAAVQYELALQRLEHNEDVLALAHLYMGVEAITRAVIDVECRSREVSEEDFGRVLGLDPTMERFGGALQSEVRRQLIFTGDMDTYRASRGASDGIEHGFATWEELWATPGDVTRRTARYLRAAILSTSGVSADVRDRLMRPPYDSFVERGHRLAFESTANIRSVDLRANDFAIAPLKRQMLSSTLDAGRGEYHYEYSLRRTGESQ